MKVKVCDMASDRFEYDLISSMKNTGFAVITNHEIHEGLIRSTQDNWRKFFLEEPIFKNLFINQRDGNMGYKGMGTETAVGAKVADIKEFFHWKPGQSMPEGPKNDTLYLFHLLENVGAQILSIVDRDNKKEGDFTSYTDDCFHSDNTILRTLYYPALKSVDRQEGAVRAAAHEDINYITLLVAASAPGLQVQDKDGTWHDVPHQENSIVVNIGDMMQLASKGKYKSTTHRVINPSSSSEDRISMPLFIHPHGYTALAPGITAQEYLDQRIAEIYGKK